MNMRRTQSIIKDYIRTSIELKQKLIDSQSVIDEIEKSSIAIISAYRNNRKLLLAGNGGSAADAQHIAAEFVNRFNFDRPGLPAIALTTDSSILTSVSNDYSFEKVFLRQAKTMGTAGDVFIGISTSGNSKNIIEAIKACKEEKIFTIGLSGLDGGLMSGLCDICIKVPSNDVPRIQEVHILIGHVICSIVEEELFGPNKTRE